VKRMVIEGQPKPKTPTLPEPSFSIGKKVEEAVRSCPSSDHLRPMAG
jgi:hypothetical protein